MKKDNKTTKTKEDFFKYLNKFLKAGVLPNGELISERKVWSYFEYENISFIGGKNQIAKKGTIREWFSQWAKVTPEYNHYKIKDAVIEGKEKINTNIDILGESTDEFEYHEGESEHIEPYEWNTRYKKILWISDLHIPYHNLQAIKTAINYGREKKVNGIIIGGDMLDMYDVSFHEKTPNKTRIVRELEMAREFFEQLRKIFPSEKIVFKEGNHEQRLERYLYRNAPAIAELDALHLKELLRMKQFNIDYVSNNQLMSIGKLTAVHGNEFKTGGGGINIARNLRLKALDNIIFANFHKTQSDFQKSVTGSIYGGWAVGCLCGLNPKWLPFPQWNHGFAVIELFDSGNFSVENKKIIEGTVL